MSVALQEAQEKFTDPLDTASRLATVENDFHVQMARNKSAPEFVMNTDGERVYQVADADGNYPIPLCVTCEEPNPLGRQQLGRIRCVDCQEEKDKKVRR